MAAVTLGMLGLMRADPTSAATDATTNNAATAGPSSILITPAPSNFKQYMDARDEAMQNKCPGGMFDCDGDRREFAKKQYADWLANDGKPKRLREGNTKGPRSF